MLLLELGTKLWWWLDIMWSMVWTKWEGYKLSWKFYIFFGLWRLEFEALKWILVSVYCPGMIHHSGVSFVFGILQLCKDVMEPCQIELVWEDRIHGLLSVGSLPTCSFFVLLLGCTILTIALWIDLCFERNGSRKRSCSSLWRD